jgi:SAM-dependent methyltransferase
MTIANLSQFESWNGESGTRWVARADERDEVLAPVADVLMAAADPTPGMQVLDIGCGCGATTLTVAARVGDAGTATGIDLSAPMLELAQQRAASTKVDNATFTHGDAQTHLFAPESLDLAISRFGTMFFADPVAAFTNIAAALRPGGRLCLATWRSLTANEWLVVPGAALLRHTDIPTTSPDGPGMFAQSDPDIVTDTLSAAGLGDIGLEAGEVTFTLGPTVDAAVDYLADSGPGRLLLETIPEGVAREAALADVRDTLATHEHNGRVRLGGGIWLITATRPPAAAKPFQ